MTIKHTNDSLNVAYFAERNPGWHSYAKDKRTDRAVERAALLGSIEISRDTRQFRVTRKHAIEVFDRTTLPLAVRSAWLALHENEFVQEAA
jgi:hypothetical protein